MAFKIVDRVKETTTGSSGTGSISLDGAASNYLAFTSQLSDGDSTIVLIQDDPLTEYELVVVTLSTGTPDTLSRDTVISSSNGGFGGSKISLSGTKTYIVSGVVSVAHTPLDITSLTAETTPTDSDLIAVYDASAGVVRKMTRSDFLTAGGTLFVQTGGDEMTGNLKFINTSRGLQFGDGSDTAFTAKFDFPDVSTANAVVQFLRDTNTTGARQVDFYKGDGSSTVVVEIDADNERIRVNSNEVWHAGNVDSAPGLDDSKGSNGYVDLPGGITEQWGSVTIAANTTVSVNYTKSFGGTPYNVTFGGSGSSTSNDLVASASSVGASSMSVTNGADSTYTYFWRVIGPT